MGGVRIWCILALLVLVGMAQAAIPTTLTQSVTPASGTAYSGVKPTFICGYVAGGNGVVVVDRIGYNLTYSLNTSDYRYSGVALSAGNHTWYCNMFKAGYQPQVGQPQNYYVKPKPSGGGSPLLVKTPLSPTEQLPVGNAWTLAVVVIAIIGLGIGYFIVRSALVASAGKKRRR